MRGRLRKAGFAETVVGECFALVREAASRTIGKRHYDSQLMAGWALLQGKLVEMETGEGKTIAATLAASAVALAGYPVHVITVNDYLAGRDAEEMGPLYRFLGLSVGIVVQGQTRDARRQAYANSLTYCTNKELAFDYLRDRVALTNRGSRLHLSLEKLCGRAQRERSWFCVASISGLSTRPTAFLSTKRARRSFCRPSPARAKRKNSAPAHLKSPSVSRPAATI